MTKGSVLGRDDIRERVVTSGRAGGVGRRGGGWGEREGGKGEKEGKEEKGEKGKIKPPGGMPSGFIVLPFQVGGAKLVSS